MMKFLYFLYVVLFSLSSFSGNEVGNGGDVIICAESITLLDYEEAKNFSFLIPAKTGKGKEAFKLAEEILKAFGEVDPKLSAQYLVRLKSIKNEIEMKKSLNLRNIEDSKHEAIPKGCDIKQIAIRRNRARPDGKRFLIDLDLWNKLSDTHRAGLILHEIIYEHFLFFGDTNSQKARFMNALVTHIGFGKKLTTPYKDLLQGQKIPIYR